MRRVALVASRHPFRLLERKVSHCGEKVQTFELEGFYADEFAVVGKWTAKGPLGCKENFGLDPGSYSWGVWPRNDLSTWGAYRIHHPCGGLKGYRFDALGDLDVRLCADGEKEEFVELTFRDLLLDARVSPSGEIRLEDEDEAEDAFSGGSISLKDWNAIANIRDTKFGTYGTVEGIRALTDRVDNLIDQAIRFASSAAQQ